MMISGYITLRSPTQMNYPFEAAIKSLFTFCDEIVVCDSTDYTKNDDGTGKTLQALKSEFEGLSSNNVFKVVVPNTIDRSDPSFVDWSAPNHGIYDGLTKAFARKNCTGDFCFQIDADEVIVSDRETMEKHCGLLVQNDELLMALPVVEYWGSAGKVRMDVNPWKWRLSVNSPRITHGIPGHLRKTVNFHLYAKHGTDGCDYIDSFTLSPIPCMGFVSKDVEAFRQRGIYEEQYAKSYGVWFNAVTDKLPTVYHFSWWSVYEKMNRYKLFWNDSWMALYNEQRPEGYNPFFSRPFSEVSDEEMKATAKALEEKCGGYIFHNPVDINNIIPIHHVTINKPIPELVHDWCEKNKH